MERSYQEIKDQIKKDGSPYELLQVTQDVTPEDLRKAYLKLSMIYHPDKVMRGDLSEEDFKTKEKEYEEKFKAMKQGHDYLKDNRKEVDQAIKELAAENKNTSTNAQQSSKSEPQQKSEENVFNKSVNATAKPEQQKKPSVGVDSTSSKTPNVSGMTEPNESKPKANIKTDGDEKKTDSGPAQKPRTKEIHTHTTDNPLNDLLAAIDEAISSMGERVSLGKTQAIYNGMVKLGKQTQSAWKDYEVAKKDLNEWGHKKPGERDEEDGPKLQQKVDDKLDKFDELNKKFKYLQKAWDAEPEDHKKPARKNISKDEPETSSQKEAFKNLGKKFEGPENDNNATPNQNNNEFAGGMGYCFKNSKENSSSLGEQTSGPGDMPSPLSSRPKPEPGLGQNNDNNASNTQKPTPKPR